MRSVIFVLSLFAVVACGYSEDEWQAQLSRYSNLEAEHANERNDHVETKQSLEREQQQVAELLAKLEAMGVNVETLSQKLAEEGTENERITADNSQLRLAVEEYRKRAAQLERIRQRFDVLRGKLQKLTNLGLKVEIRHNRMVISLPGDVLFASGQDRLREGGIDVLKAVADVVRTDAALNARYFQIAGHTDSKPLRRNTRYRDNWGLSAMRAREVLVYLVGAVDTEDPTKSGGGLDPLKLHAAGYGDTDPIADNETDEGRQSNRRVELVLMPDVEEMLDLRTLL